MIDQLNSRIKVLTGEVKLLEGTKLHQEKRIESIQSELEQCQSGVQGVVVIRKELDLCRDELTDEKDSKEQLSKDLRIAKGNIKTLEDGKEALQNELNSKKAETENLRNQTGQLQNVKTRILSELSGIQTSLDACQSDRNIICKGPIVGNNGLSLLKKPSEIQVCQEYGIYDKPENSLLVFYPYAKDGDYFEIINKAYDYTEIRRLKDGNNKAVITRGLSTYLDKTAKLYKIGNKDKILTPFNTNGNVEYQLEGACGVLYQGLIHFFGGFDNRYRNQHFGFDGNRNFVQYKSLVMSFTIPQCSTLNISKPNSQSCDREFVLLCFDAYHDKNCYKYEADELTHFADAAYGHYHARLGKYRDQLITVGDYANHQKTEILDRSDNEQYKWTLGSNTKFSSTGKIYDYSMVNIPQIGFQEEFLLLIGGEYSGGVYSDRVYKFNGKWSFFGRLQKKRAFHSSVFLNGKVLIIGGQSWGQSGDQSWGIISEDHRKWLKTEIWDSSKSHFETESTWPELNYWTSYSNLVFIIPDFINP